jgi:MYXO-CTERM domain-containing protein
VGCGAGVRQICCPGQACRIDPNGRPSCENAGTCVVVTGASDSGLADAPMSAGDAGASGDGGGKGGDSSGCGCRTGSGPGLSGVLPLALLGLCLARRRRR